MNKELDNKYIKNLIKEWKEILSITDGRTKEAKQAKQSIKLLKGLL